MNPFINGEVAALRSARAKAQVAVEAYDAAITILTKAGGGYGVPKPDTQPQVKTPVTREALRAKAVRDYLNGDALKVVGRRYNVSDATVRYWVLAAGEKNRNRKQAQRLRVARESR